MRRSLQGKLIISYLIIALITVLVVSAIIQLTSGQFMLNLVAEQQTALLKESAQTYYAAQGTLEVFFDYYVQASRVAPAQAQPGAPDNPPRISWLAWPGGYRISGRVAHAWVRAWTDRASRADPPHYSGRSKWNDGCLDFARYEVRVQAQC